MRRGRGKTTREVTNFQQAPYKQKCNPFQPMSIFSEDEVWTHHEFRRFGGKVSAIDLPIIWFSSPERLQKINEIFTKHGFTVYDAHINQIEAGGLHNTNFKHLAWKKRLDPKGLLNSAKSAAWNSVKELSPEEIEAKEIG